jgi:uncharacterized YigZ family protein
MSNQKSNSNQTIDDYLIPAKSYQSEIKVKGSRFIASIIPVTSKEEAEEEYNILRKKYYNATHNCFAWRISENLWRYSDDGEPSGTAGKPILQAIEGAGLYEILCVVTRYYGGTKLGTGGLIRAYGEAAQKAINEIQKKIKTHFNYVNLKFEYSFENFVRRTISEYKSNIVTSDYSDNIKMEIAVPQSLSAQFAKVVKEKSNSEIDILIKNSGNIPEE